MDTPAPTASRQRERGLSRHTASAGAGLVIGPAAFLMYQGFRGMSETFGFRAGVSVGSFAGVLILCVPVVSIVALADVSAAAYAGWRAGRLSRGQCPWCNYQVGVPGARECPECGGALWQLDDPGLVRFRCHVGHAYNGEVLLAE